MRTIIGVASTAVLLLGIDVSQYQGRVQWARVAKAVTPLGRVAFAICRATSHNDHVDTQFYANWKGIGETSLIRGAYHFAGPDALDRDAVREADHFVGTVMRAGGFRRGVDFLALDLETSKVQKGKAFTDWAIAFLERVDALTGQKCWLYVGGPFLDDNDGPGLPPPEVVARLTNRPLWLPAYVGDRAEKFVPEQFRSRSLSYAIHQRTGDLAGGTDELLHVDGVGNGVVNVDGNRFRGTADDLRSLILSTVNEAKKSEGDGNVAAKVAFGVGLLYALKKLFFG